MHSLKDMLMENLRKSGKTVFNLSDIYNFAGVEFGLRGDKTVKFLSQLLIKNLVKEKLLLKLRKNFYALDNKYDKKEFACALFSNSYVSFETILKEHNMLNEKGNLVTVASYLSRKLGITGTQYIYREVKKEIVSNNVGLLLAKNGYKYANPERAFLDLLYIKPNYRGFKNLDKLNKEKIKVLLNIYNNKKLAERLKKILEI